MAVYKVPQDVEAEDKLIGPFTLKQFIFLIVAAIAGYLTFILATINPLLVILTLPLTIIFAILGVYRRADQPVEIYLASLARFYLKPRRRIWDQDGIMQPVKITVPPKEEHQYTDGRTVAQVESQLNSLANIMDTRGWAAKNANLQVPNQVIAPSDRLVNINELPAMNQPSEIHSADDMYDLANNQVAQNLSTLTDHTSNQLIQSAVQPLQQPGQTVQPTYNNAASANQTGQQGFQLYPTGATDRVGNNTSQAPNSSQVQPAQGGATEFDPKNYELSSNSDLNLNGIASSANQPKREIDEENNEISLR